MLRSAAIAIFVSSAPALADISVQFTESAPKDSFRITNLGACPAGPLEVLIDLGSSSAGLIFDTTSRGAGVEVFQPFELVTGTGQVTTHSRIADGDTVATLSISKMPVNGEVAFTIDVDDTLASSSNGQIMVSGSEIEGASVKIKSPGGRLSIGQFDQRGTATGQWNTCES